VKYRKYLRTSHWKEFRQQLLYERGVCEHCGTTERLDVHHMTYDRLGDEAPEDVSVLCRDCHNEEHGFPDQELKSLEALYDD